MNIENTQLEFITLAIYEGVIHVVAMKKDDLDAISFLQKTATTHIAPTNKSFQELLEFLDYKGVKQ